MKRRKMRLCALVLTLFMVIGFSPTAAFAAASQKAAFPEDFPPEENLIRNPGFEDGEAEWAYLGADIDFGCSEIPENGESVSALVCPTDSDALLVQDLNGVIQDQTTFMLSFFYRIEPGYVSEDTKISAGLFGTDDTGATAYLPMVELSPNEPTDWAQVMGTTSIPNNFSVNNFFFYFENYEGIFFLDNLFLAPVGLQNAGFEDGLNGWDLINPEKMQIAATTIQAKEGSTSLLIGGKQTSFNSHIEQDFAYMNAGYYEISAYAKAAYAFTGDGVVIEAEAIDADGNITSTAQAKSGNGIINDWGRVSCKIAVPAGTDCLRIKIGSLNSDCVFFVDDVQLKGLGAVPSDNLLQNEGFENELSGWSSVGTPYAYITTAQKHSGEKALSMGYFANEGLTKYIAQSYHIVIQGKLQFSAWVKTDANLTGAGAALFIDALDKNGNVLKTVTSSTISNSGGAWQKASVTIELPEGTAEVTAKIGGIYCTGVFYVDDAILSYV